MIFLLNPSFKKGKAITDSATSVEYNISINDFELISSLIPSNYIFDEETWRIKKDNNFIQIDIYKGASDVQLSFIYTMIKIIYIQLTTLKQEKFY